MSENTNSSERNALSSRIEDMIKSLSDDEKEAIGVFLSRSALFRSIWRAPIPPPEILKTFNETAPNAADRILRLSEAQTAHRHMIQKMIVSRGLKQSGRGQLLAFTIALSFLFAAVLLVLNGYPVSGTIIGTVDIVALVSVFIYGNYSQNKNSHSPQ